MLSPIRALAILLGGLTVVGLASAQLAISTHSGLVQLTVGSVFLDDQPVHKTPTNMVEMKPGQVLRTGKDGNVEVLLTPGVFLRLGNTSSIRMETNSLSNTKVSVLSGSSLVECDELLSDNAVSFAVGNQVVQLRKKGLFRLEADPPALGVMKGEAYVAGTFNQVVKQGKLLQFDQADAKPEKFHQDKNEELVAFSKARAEDNVYATGVTASSLYTSGYTGCSNSSWYLMGGVGMYSYLPCNGMSSSPYGLTWLGLNSGYMWMGPSYYMPPYALYGYGYGGYPTRNVVTSGGGGGGGVPATTAVNNGKTPNPAIVNSLVHGSRAQNSEAIANGQRVPLFGTVPNGTVLSRMPHGMAGANPNFGHSGAGMSRTMQNMAGPSLGRSAAMGAAHPSAAPMGGGGYHGGPAGGGASSAPAMRSAPMPSAGMHSSPARTAGK